MPGSNSLLAAFDKQLTELIERWKSNESRMGRGRIELCSAVLLPGFYMVDLYPNASVYRCCHKNICSSCLCRMFLWFLILLCLSVNRPGFWSNGWSMDGVCFFPMYLHFVIILSGIMNLMALGAERSFHRDVKWASNNMISLRPSTLLQDLCSFTFWSYEHKFFGILH